jgi:DNA-binding transcriptional LysR family regulator
VSRPDAGIALLEEGRLVPGQLARAAIAAQRAGRGELGRVVIGYVASAAASGGVPGALAQFRSVRPDVEVELTALETPRQLAALREGSLDLGLLRPRSTYPEGIQTHVVPREELLLAVATGHRLARRRVRSAALAGERFVLPQFEEEDGFGANLAHLARLGGFLPGPVLRVRDFLTALSLAAAGYGLALVPRSVTTLSLTGISYQKIEDFNEHVALVAAWRRSNGSAALRALLANLPAVD